MYVESYENEEVYAGLWIMLVYSCVDCDSLFLYDISSLSYRLDWIRYSNRQDGAKLSSHVESYNNVWKVCAYRYLIVAVGVVSSGS